MQARGKLLASIRKFLASEWYAARDASRDFSADAIPAADARRTDAVADQRAAALAGRKSGRAGARAGYGRAGTDLRMDALAGAL